MTGFGDEDPEVQAKRGMPGHEVASEWVHAFVEGEHKGQEGPFMALDGEHD